MTDLRSVGFVVGAVTAALGAFMFLPMIIGLGLGDDDWIVFLIAGLVTIVAGASMALACRGARRGGLPVRQAFLITTLVWLVLPVFAALPFMLGSPALGITDAVFEVVSGMTTTGTTVLVGLDTMAPGILFWRSLLQWLGGLGIIVVALIFLPVMQVGGMQFFRTEGFDTLGKVLPRALDISRGLVSIYLLLTGLCAIVYLALGMRAFDALNHAMTTIATGGYSTRDTSFAAFSHGVHYAAVLFMVLSGLPFIRFVQLMGGDVRPLFQDVQVRAYVRWTLYAVGAVALWQVLALGAQFETALRETAFNVVSLFSGTGYATADVAGWGTFPLIVVMVAGMIGACTASTGCSVKVFRYLVLIQAVKAQILRLQSPSRVAPLRLAGQPIERDVIDAVIALFTLFLVTFGLVAVALAAAGLDTRTAVTAAWTSVFNIGPVFGPGVGPTGAVDGFSATVKWIMVSAMVLGRLELVTVLVLLLPRFWRD